MQNSKVKSPHIYPYGKTGGSSAEGVKDQFCNLIKVVNELFTAGYSNFKSFNSL